jgi:hypothetical protein
MVYLRLQFPLVSILTTLSLIRAVFWVILPCKVIVDRRFRGAYNHFTRQYNPEDSSEHHTRRRENLKSHTLSLPDITPKYAEPGINYVCVHASVVSGLLSNEF